MKRILAIVVALCVIQEPLPAFASRVIPSRPSALQESFIQNRFEQDAIVYRALGMRRLIDPLARPLVRQLRTWRRPRLAGAIERLGRPPSVPPATGGMRSL